MSGTVNEIEHIYFDFIAQVYPAGWAPLAIDTKCESSIRTADRLGMYMQS